MTCIHRLYSGRQKKKEMRKSQETPKGVGLWREPLWLVQKGRKCTSEHHMETDTPQEASWQKQRRADRQRDRRLLERSVHMRMSKGFQNAMTKQTSFSEGDGGTSLQPPYLFIFFSLSFLPHKHLLAQAALRHNETKSSRVGVGGVTWHEWEGEKGPGHLRTSQSQSQRKRNGDAVVCCQKERCWQN